MRQQTNYMKLSENLWTRALDLKIHVKQTEEKNLVFSIILKQLTQREIIWCYIWEFALAYYKHNGK